MRHLRAWQADILLLAVAFFWGSTFLLVKSALEGITPFVFLAIRFITAFICLFLVYRPGKKIFNKQLWQASLLIGFFLFAGYALQTVGLMFTTASNAGFITGLSVILVPFFSIFLTKKPPSIYVVSGAISAALGLALLSLGPGLSLRIGDLLVFGCACGFALHIILVGRYVGRFEPNHLAMAQILVVGLLSTIMSIILPQEAIPNIWSGQVILALAITSILATAFAFVVQNNVQRFTTPARTAIILSAEPVFAAITSFTIGGEPLTIKILIGSVLILGGILIAELKGNH